MATEVTSLSVATEHQVARWAGVHVCPEPASVSQTPKSICPKAPLWAFGGWPVAEPPESSRGIQKPAAFWGRSSRPLRQPGLLTYSLHVEC